LVKLNKIYTRMVTTALPALSMARVAKYDERWSPSAKSMN
jgi:hypothetical protein